MSIPNRQQNPRHSNDILEEICNILSKQPPSEDLPAEVKPVLHSRPDDVLRLAHEKLHAFPFKDVPWEWRRAYEEAAVGKALATANKELSRWKTGRTFICLRGCEGRGGSHLRCVNERLKSCRGSWIDELVRTLDMAVIMTGAPERKELSIDPAFKALEEYLGRIEGLTAHSEGNYEAVMLGTAEPFAVERAPKRQKTTSSHERLPATWPSDKLHHPVLSRPVHQAIRLSVSEFQGHLNRGTSDDGPSPILIKDALCHWPAIDPEIVGRHWNNPQYLLKRTLGGRRLVPIEIGRSYTDEGWGQKIITVRDFLEQYMLESPLADESMSKPPPVQQNKAYLAQHDIFAQIPALRSDICVPDYCYASPPPQDLATSRKSSDVEDNESVDPSEPQLNAWFGPAGTVSPAHTDPHHNIFAQVVGYKYIRLFAPSQSRFMSPRGVDDDGIDMSNTSQVDVGLAMKVHEGHDWGDGDQRAEATFETQFPEFRQAEYLEAVLGPTDCLYVPRAWWHYVRSLSPSFSVSFWWH